MEGLRQSNKGFTLVEICVTLVIISVLASITTFSLIAWTHDSQFNKMEQNAELIYMAVRNKMAIYKANGAIFEIEGMDTFDPNGDNSEDGDSQSRSSMGQYTYIFCNNDDYGALKGKKTPKSETARLLFDYISSYIYDKTILDAYISIEFDMKTGDVIGVYYSDRTKFYYKASDTGGSISDGVNISDLKSDYSKRYEMLVGSYIPG